MTDSNQQRAGGIQAHEMNGISTAAPGPSSTPAPPSEALLETALVQQAQAGDVAAFEKLYHRHVGRVYALCLRMCGEATEAEELAQEAFVRSWEKLPSFKGGSAFGSWLHRLTVNVVLGRWRSRGRRRQRVVAIGEVARIDPKHEPKPRMKVDLERAIGTLPAGARTVFVLHDIEGFTHPDISEMTGLAVGTCKAQLHRARRLLRKSLNS